jgi:single-stranded-DNA-specific exonuclease
LIKIKCKLYNEPNESLNAIQQLLYNRGIDVDKQQEWLVASEFNINNPLAFGKSSKLEEIVKIIQKCIVDKLKIVVIVDPDMDGYTSSAIFINYLWNIAPEYTLNRVSYIMHEGKQHGLNDLVENILEEQPDYVFSPDGGTNDIEAHKKLDSCDIGCVVLDHHECEIDIHDSPAYILNVQASDYPNKQLSGAGVVWQVCRYHEFLYNTGDTTSRLLDLCACGNCGDMMDYRELEVRSIVVNGLTNLNNPLIKGMAKAHDYSIQKMNGLNYYSCAFYIVPYINAICRSGTIHEKEFVFSGLLELCANTEVANSKRGHKGEYCSWYEEAITVTERVKRRQTEAQNTAMDFLETQIEEENLTDNAIIICECGEDDIDPNVVGLVANKIQAKYQHPAMVLRKVKDQLTGSARNYSNCEIENMKEVCSNTGLMTLAAGHESAFGSAMLQKDKEDFISKTNEVYSDVEFVPVYWIDYCWDTTTCDYDKILTIGDSQIYGQNVPESLVMIKDIHLSKNMLTLMGKNKDTIKITFPNGVCAIMFRQSEELFNKMCQDNMVLNIVAKCNCNEWNGRVTPQLLVEDFELREEWVF